MMSIPINNFQFHQVNQQILQGSANGCPNIPKIPQQQQASGPMNMNIPLAAQSQREFRTPNAAYNLTAHDINLPLNDINVTDLRRSGGVHAKNFVQNGALQSATTSRRFLNFNLNNNVNEDQRLGIPLGGSQQSVHFEARSPIQTENMNNFNRATGTASNSVFLPQQFSAQQQTQPQQQDDSIFSRPFGEGFFPMQSEQPKRNESDQLEELKNMGQSQQPPQDQSVSYPSKYQYLYDQNYQNMVTQPYMTARSYNSSRKNLTLKNSGFPEVMIRNIDRETASKILSELDKLKLQSLTYNFIDQNILIVTFSSHESAQQVIQQYDGKFVNGRKLQVNKFVFTGKRCNTTQLFKINEMNDQDEEQDQEQNTPTSTAVASQQEQVSNQSLVLPRPAQIQPSMTSQKQQIRVVNRQQFHAQQINNLGQISNGFQNQMIQTMQYPTNNHKFLPNQGLQSISPPPMSGLRMQNFNMNASYQNMPYYQEGELMNQFSQNHPINLQNANQNYQGNIQGGNYPNQQYYGTHQMQVTPHYQSYYPPNHGYPPSAQQSQITQMEMRREPQLNDSNFQSTQKMRFSVPMDGKSHTDQSNKSSFDPNTYSTESAFGYNTNGSGLLLQQQPQNLIQNQNLNNNSKLSSVDMSQEDDQLFHVPHDQYSGSDRGSFNHHPTQRLSNLKVPNSCSTKNSDSDNSKQLLQFQNKQMYQSPLSLQKASVSQRFQDNSFDLAHNTSSGSFLTPCSQKHLNHSFNFPISGTQSMTYLRQDNLMNNSHNRNLSHNQQILHGVGSGDLNNFGGISHQNAFLLTQKMNMMHHSVSYVNINNQIHSNSSEMNDPSLYGVPLQPSYFQNMGTLSSLNSSMEQMSLNSVQQQQNYQQARKKNQQKSHQTLKNNYSESSEFSNDSVMELDIEKIKNGEDMRTTLMIKNIPNKYNQRAILQEINEKHQGRYDFLYLPIDFQQKANVGYAFINFKNPLFIIPFYYEFHKRRWTKYNSQKICQLKYGRIQGLQHLQSHFRSSSVMNQADESLRPRIFDQNSNQFEQTQEMIKIIERFNIQTPLEKFFVNTPSQHVAAGITQINTSAAQVSTSSACNEVTVSLEEKKIDDCEKDNQVEQLHIEASTVETQQESAKMSTNIAAKLALSNLSQEEEAECEKEGASENKPEGQICDGQNAETSS